MRKKDNKQPAKNQQPLAETFYAKRHRRRAEKIIAATADYSAAFRDEVQQALEKLPHKLPLLFQEADEINRKLATRSRMLDAGLPVQRIPMQRPPKVVSIRMAEEIESLFAQYENEDLDEQMTKRTELIKSVLFDLQTLTQVFCTHPKVVKAYVLAIWDALGATLRQRDFDRVHEVFKQACDLMNGCSQDRFEQISEMYSLDLNLPMKAHTESASVYEEDQGDVAALREELRRLERVPENEAIRFQLETEICQLEREAGAAGEWPDVIGAASS